MVPSLYATLIICSTGAMSVQPLATRGKDAIDVGRDEVLKEQKKEEFSRALTLGFNGSFNNNQNVVGVEDGWAVNLGVVLEGAAGVAAGKHDWHNDLRVQHTQTLTPPIDRFIKSADAFKLRTLYVYHAVEWLGPFAQAKVDTQLARGYAVRAEEVTVQRIERDGTARPPRVRPAQSSISLTSALEPLVLNQAVGAYVRPTASDYLTVEGKLGAGAQQILVGDGFTIADDLATPALELVQLSDASEVGAVLELGANGKVNDDLTWSLAASFFLPVAPGAGTGEPEGFARLNSDVSGKVSVRLAESISLDYVLTAKRVPLVLEEWQITNGLLLTAGFNIL